MREAQRFESPEVKAVPQPRESIPAAANDNIRAERTKTPEMGLVAKGKEQIREFVWNRVEGLGEGKLQRWCATRLANGFAKKIDVSQSKIDDYNSQIASVGGSDRQKTLGLHGEQAKHIADGDRMAAWRSRYASVMDKHYQRVLGKPDEIGTPRNAKSELEKDKSSREGALGRLTTARDLAKQDFEKFNAAHVLLIQRRAYGEAGGANAAAKLVGIDQEIKDCERNITSMTEVINDLDTKLDTWNAKYSSADDQAKTWAEVAKNGRHRTSAAERKPETTSKRSSSASAGLGGNVTRLRPQAQRNATSRPESTRSFAPRETVEANSISETMAAIAELIREGRLDLPGQLKKMLDDQFGSRKERINEGTRTTKLIDAWNQLAKRDPKSFQMIEEPDKKKLLKVKDKMTLVEFGSELRETLKFESDEILSGIALIATAIDKGRTMKNVE